MTKYALICRNYSKFIQVHLSYDFKMSKTLLLYFLLLLNFCISDIRKPVPIPFEIISLQMYSERREKQTTDEILIFYLTNSTGNADDVTDLFYDGAELAASFVKKTLSFAIVYDSSIKSNRIVCSYPGIPQQSFKLNEKMISPEVATKILHLASRTLKQARRGEKEKKNPMIARLKAEIRSNHQLLKKASNDDAKKELLQVREKLISQYLETIPERKRSIKKLKLQNKEIQNSQERKGAKKAYHQMEKSHTSNQNNDSLNEHQKHHKYMKKAINNLRESWKLSHFEESHYNREEMLQQRYEKRKEREEHMMDDSEEMEQMLQMLKNMKDLTDENKEKIGLDEERSSKRVEDADKPEKEKGNSIHDLTDDMRKKLDGL